MNKEMRLSVRIKHKVSDEYGRHKENDLSDVSSKHNAGVRTVIVTDGERGRIGDMARTSVYTTNQMNEGTIHC